MKAEALCLERDRASAGKRIENRRRLTGG